MLVNQSKVCGAGARAGGQQQSGHYNCDQGESHSRKIVIVVSVYLSTEPSPGKPATIQTLTDFRIQRYFLRSLSALATTNTLDMAIAPAASMGDNSSPVTGYNTPAATGIRLML